ncbi:hypothetical protein PENTCL1PPCAC_1624, partial [Pristionchus entomophagus]
KLKLTATEPVCHVFAECGARTLEWYITNDEIIQVRNGPGRRSLLCNKGQFSVRKIPPSVVIFDDILREVTRNAVCVNHAFVPSGKIFYFRNEEINVDRKLVPHAGIEPATFCLLDRRSATEPMRRLSRPTKL